MSVQLTAVISSLALAGAFALSTADAADEAGNPTKGSLAPAGEGPGAQGSAPSRASANSRADVKANTAAANKAGALVPAGQTVAPAPAIASGSTKSRSDVKDAAKADRAAGALQPAGEAAQPANEAPKK